jgi:uncharacterized membrane protein YheB (UPF0754 family)
MNSRLSDSLAKHQAATRELLQLKKWFASMGGSGMKDQFSLPVHAVLESRSAVVREVCASAAQKQIELETLKLFMEDAEGMSEAERALIPVKIAFLRVLARDVVKAIHQLPVEKKLRKCVQELHGMNWEELHKKEQEKAKAESEKAARSKLGGQAEEADDL